jgi:hypothetical protein
MTFPLFGKLPHCAAALALCQSNTIPLLMTLSASIFAGDDIFHILFLLSNPRSRTMDILSLAILSARLRRPSTKVE